MNTVSLIQKRIHSVDLLRGLVMIIMALDHTRDFVHVNALTDNPLNFSTTTPLLFLTRWITHFCAPVFVFLSGVSVYLQSMRKSKKELSSFLIKRGLWLILAEIFIFNLIFSFDFTYSVTAFQVIWAIGISMIVLGIVIWLPYPVILGLGLLIVFGHNCLDFYEKDQTGGFSVAYELIHRPDFISLGGRYKLLILYPFLPWTGLMLLGYCLGKLIVDSSPEQRKKLLTRIGLATILLFIVLRWLNIYGDPSNWSGQKTTLYTIFSFINCTKYPPSLLFMSMTIGPALLFMAWFGDARSRLAQFISVYGRVPFFYFMLHFLLIHIIATILFFTRGHSFAEAVSLPLVPRFVIPGEGYSLGIVYLVWAAVILIMYPLCKWYDQYKTSHKDKKWLSYL